MDRHRRKDNTRSLWLLETFHQTQLNVAIMSWHTYTSMVRELLELCQEVKCEKERSEYIQHSIRA